MPRFESPNAFFTGYIVLPEWWNIKQLRTFEGTLPDPNNGVLKENLNRVVYKGETMEKRLPAMVGCGIEWHIDHVPEQPTLDTFPVTPVKAAGELVDWVYGLLQDVWLGEITVPNA